MTVYYPQITSMEGDIDLATIFLTQEGLLGMLVCDDPGGVTLFALADVIMRHQRQSPGEHVWAMSNIETSDPRYMKWDYERLDELITDPKSVPIRYSRSEILDYHAGKGMLALDHRDGAPPWLPPRLNVQDYFRMFRKRGWRSLTLLGTAGGNMRVPVALQRQADFWLVSRWKEGKLVVRGWYWYTQSHLNTFLRFRRELDGWRAYYDYLTSNDPLAFYDSTPPEPHWRMTLEVPDKYMQKLLNLDTPEHAPKLGV